MFMGFELFRKQVKADVFDYQMLMDFLRDLKKPRDKISSLISEGKIVRVKKGLYVFGEDLRQNPLNLETIANLIYGPSCVSFEYALSNYGLLSERPKTITSLTIGDSKILHTPLGTFEYRAVSREKFGIGIDYKDNGKGEGYFIASPEKALIDLVYKTPGIRTLNELRYYLFEEMRVDEALFRNFDFKKIAEITKVYHKNSTTLINFL
ncbi:MAG: hypothetical protein V4489_08215 [Chlamydiota bacterium]